MSARLPEPLRRALEHGLERVGRPGRVVRAEPLGGGCVNHASRLDLERGDAVFLKWNARAPAGMFTAEAEGLRALAEGARGWLRVPEVIAVGEPEGGVPGWLVLELVPAGRPARDYPRRLGAGLAGLHRARAEGASWGWPRDNFIGPLPQPNAPAGSWGAFWRDRRLAPQLALARAAGHFGNPRERRLLERLLDRTEALLAPLAGEPPALLHGDLWSGNVFADGGGAPVLVDPAAYRGHREVDLAMSELFGGFPAGWPRAYDEAWPLNEGYARCRRALYQLYYLLVHVVLFGAGYAAGCVHAAEEALAGE